MKAKTKPVIRKVYYFWRGSQFLPMIRLQGKYLDNLGYKVGDFIEVTATKNSITITKHQKTA